jgi:ribosomal protein S18 acetylase RimI-like enzyme
MNSHISTASAPDDFRIRGMEMRDLPEVVQVHLSSFVNFFLTFLGAAFLKELYRGTIEDPSGIAIVADSDGGIWGFVSGSVSPSGFYRRLILQRWWRFGLACVIPAVQRPSVIPRLLRAFAMPGQTAHKTERGTLMSIAMRPDVQGKGIGKALVLAFLEEAGRRGVRKVDLTTDAVGNEIVNRFYENLGFVCEREFKTPERRLMREYAIDFKLYE